MSTKRILVIGGTGAQGSMVVRALLAAKPAFSVRVLSRDPESDWVKEVFAGLDVEVVKGTFMDPKTVAAALKDCYGVWVNTDSGSAKAADEIFAAMRIWEVSKQTRTLRHFLWSGIDYHLKVANFNPRYGSYHTNSKGRVNEFLQNQASSASEDGLTWTIVNTATYDEMLSGGLFAPTLKPDGTRVFALPIGKGHIPMMSLEDNGAIAVLIFQNRAHWSGKTLNFASHWATGPELAETLEKVAGVKAVFENISFDEWVTTTGLADVPVSSTDPEGPTFRESFQMWWWAFEDDILFHTRDLAELKRIYPGLMSLEDWMRKAGYDGTPKLLLKSFVEAKIGPGFENGELKN